MNQSGPTEPVGSIEPNPFTKEILNRAPSLHARRRDHLLVLAIVLLAPATTARALPAGPPTVPDGPNLTNIVSKQGLTRENWSLQVDAPAMLRLGTPRTKPNTPGNYHDRSLKRRKP
ncbi:hypothetical protein F511_25227 [Dorcoceras hygrometricum]|uniref:Uncharacterized protein n=1 Tax=Dorcoceras hygrometricum TaxID=472368 RepID=A0A2Z7BBQ4_9LAMI|nr:hypothetical protein F511_25227 [Dorcoceras hygrometricum]